MLWSGYSFVRFSFPKAGIFFMREIWGWIIFAENLGTCGVQSRFYANVNIFIKLNV